MMRVGGYVRNCRAIIRGQRTENREQIGWRGCAAHSIVSSLSVRRMSKHEIIRLIFHVRHQTDNFRQSFESKAQIPRLKFPS